MVDNKEFTTYLDREYPSSNLTNRLGLYIRDFGRIVDYTIDDYADAYKIHLLYHDGREIKFSLMKKGL